MSASIQSVVEAVGQVATKSGAYVVAGLLIGEEESQTLVVDLEVAEFLALISHAKPRVIYLLKGEFEAHAMALAGLTDDADEAADVEEENETPDDEIAADPRFRSLVKRWQARDGQSGTVVASFMVDGVLHRIVESETWVDDFRDEVSELAEALGTEADNKYAEDATIEAAEIERMAKQLLADPLFFGPKVSRAKREYLAKHKFAGADEQTISLVVEEAENMHWLANSGAKKS
jgi:hypothetical protein